MDLITVWLHRGEGLHRDILDEGAAQGEFISSPGPQLGMPLIHERQHATLMPQYGFFVTHLTQVRGTVTVLTQNRGSNMLASYSHIHTWLQLLENESAVLVST